MPCSRAMRRATGEAFARPPLPSGEGAADSAAAAAGGAGSGSGAAAGGSTVAAGAAAAGASLGAPLPDASACCVASAGALSRAGASPPAPMRAMTSPMGSVSPSWATIDSVPGLSAS